MGLAQQAMTSHCGLAMESKWPRNPGRPKLSILYDAAVSYYSKRARHTLTNVLRTSGASDEELAVARKIIATTSGNAKCLRQFTRRDDERGVEAYMTAAMCVPLNDEGETLVNPRTVHEMAAGPQKTTGKLLLKYRQNSRKAKSQGIVKYMELARGKGKPWLVANYPLQTGTGGHSVKLHPLAHPILIHDYWICLRRNFPVTVAKKKDTGCEVEIEISRAAALKTLASAPTIRNPPMNGIDTKRIRGKKPEKFVTTFARTVHKMCTKRKKVVGIKNPAYTDLLWKHYELKKKRAATDVIDLDDDDDDTTSAATGAATSASTTSASSGAGSC